MREGSRACVRAYVSPLSLRPISPLLLVRFTLCKQEAVAPFLGGTLFICPSPGTLSSSSSLPDCISAACQPTPCRLPCERFHPG